MLTGRGRILAPILMVVAATTGAVACSAQRSTAVSLPGALTSATPLAARPSGHPTTTRPSSPSPQTARQAALEVVRRYYHVINSLHRTMDAAALATLLTQSCPCQTQVEAIRAAAARDERYVDRASVNVMRASMQDARHAYVLVNLDTGRGGLVTSNGQRLTSAPPRLGVQRVFRLVRQRQRWSIAAIEAG